MKKYVRWCLLLTVVLLFTGCGFQLRGETHLAPPLQRIYVQSVDPYGSLVRTLRQYLKMSNVYVTDIPQDATTQLVILQDTTSQDLLSVSGTQQTRQYNLKVTVVFEITDNKGHVIIPAQELIEGRPITVQSNQILGSSNEANLFYQQMRRSLAYAILNRMASIDVTETVNNAFPPTKSVSSARKHQ